MTEITFLIMLHHVSRNYLLDVLSIRSNILVFLLRCADNFTMCEPFSPVTHYSQLSSNMASQIANDHYCVKHYPGVYDQNSIVNSCPCR